MHVFTTKFSLISFVIITVLYSVITSTVFATTPLSSPSPNKIGHLSGGSMGVEGGLTQAISIPPASTNTNKPTSGSMVLSVGHKQQPSESASGLWLKDMEMNDFLSIMARKMNLQHCVNPALSGIFISAHLMMPNSPSVDDINEITSQYGVMVVLKRNSLYAVKTSQLGALPKHQYTYALQYLRTQTRDDVDRMLGIVKPLLSEGGSANFEPKTATLIVVDNEYSIDNIDRLLHKVDVPKKQVVVDVRILRLNNQSAHRLGVDWSPTLGEQGLTVGVTAAGRLDKLVGSVPVTGASSTIAAAILNRLLGGGADGGTVPSGQTTVPGTGTDPNGTQAATGVGLASGTTTGASDAGIILSPVQINVVLRALIDRNLATQESGPGIITEDNEQAIFRIVDRIPIVEQTVSQANGVNNISSNVRYKIDPSDSNDPATSREVGVSIAVIPQILPDNTIRLHLQPRVATITKYTTVQTGVPGVSNQYPNVNETSADAIARLPDGYSLILGGYYETQEISVDNKVPFLGDIPGLNFAFKSKQRQKIRSNILFVITPMSYTPSEVRSAIGANELMRQRFTPPKHLDYPDNDMPKETADPNLGQRLSNLFHKNSTKTQPPIISPDNPVNTKGRRIITPQQQNQELIQEQMTGVKDSQEL